MQNVARVRNGIVLASIEMLLLEVVHLVRKKA